MREERYFVAVLVFGIATVVGVVWLLDSDIQRDTNACTAKGGVLIKTYGGRQCVKMERLK